MKRFKSILCVTIVLIMIVCSFTACQTTDKETQDELDSEINEFDKEEEKTQEELDSDINEFDKEEEKTQEELLLEMNELDRADELSRLSDEAMNEKTSYKSTMVGEIQTTIDGNKVINQIKSEESYLFGNTENFVHQNRSENTIKFSDKESVTVSIEGYQNGYMYAYNKEDDSIYAFKSPISREQYVRHMNNMTADVGLKLDRDGCKEISAKRNDDGTWTITYSNFTDENLRVLLKDLQNPEQIFGESYKIVDVNIIINVLSDFTIKNGTVSFEIEKQDENNGAITLSSENNTETAPVLAFEVSYEYDNLTEVVEKIDLSSSEYKAVNDLRDYYNVEKKLDELKNSDKGSSIVEALTVVDLKGQKSSTFEKNRINYEVKDGNLEYEIRQTRSDGYNVITYVDGYYKVVNVAGETKQNSKISEATARAYLGSLLDVVQLGLESIENIENKGNGEYCFTLKQDESSYEAILDVYGGYAKSNSTTLTIKIENGKIVSYLYNMSAKVYLSTISSEMCIDQTVECSYEY